MRSLSNPCKELDCGGLAQEVADGVRRARARTGLTQMEFSDLISSARPRTLRITRGDISKYETGRVVPPAHKYLKLIKVSEKYIAQLDT